MKHTLLVASLLAALPLAAQADGWTGSGELGLAAARGNSRSENLNGKLSVAKEDEEWKHSYSVAALRARGEVEGDFDGDGTTEEVLELSANRYELGASSAVKLSDVSSLGASARYENDDFAPFEHQTTVALNFGREWIKDDEASLNTELGPGYRRAKDAATHDSVSDAIVRGQVDYKHKLTGNTELFNKLLVESGDENTFAQNDFGVQVAMNASFALKAGIQLRHNTDAAPELDKTDTLTTVNLVYNLHK